MHLALSSCGLILRLLYVPWRGGQLWRWLVTAHTKAQDASVGQKGESRWDWKVLQAEKAWRFGRLENRLEDLCYETTSATSTQWYQGTLRCLGYLVASFALRGQGFARQLGYGGLVTAELAHEIGHAPRLLCPGELRQDPLLNGGATGLQFRSGHLGRASQCGG